MSCKLKIGRGWSQLPTGNTKSTLLTRALFWELLDSLQAGGTEPQQASPVCMRDHEVRPGHPALQNRVHP